MAISGVCKICAYPAISIAPASSPSPATLPWDQTSGGLPVASYLLGEVNSFSRYVSSSLHAGERQTRTFTYAQDTWRMSPRIAVNYGLRWEIYNPQTVTSARNGGWLQLDTGEIKVAGVNGVPLNGGVRNTYTNLAPRLGIAYQVES